MKKSMLAYIAIFSVILLGPIRDLPARADISPATTFVGTHYEGQVTSLDADSQSGTILTRFGQKLLQFKITPDTKIWQTQPMAARNLRNGSTVMVMGKEDNKTGTHVTPYVVNVLPELPPASTDPNPMYKGQARILFGTLTLAGDDYTLVDRAGKTITLAGKANKMLVGQTVPGTMNDVDEGSPIKLDGKIDNGTFNVSRLVIAPGFKRGGFGKKNKGNVNGADLAAVGERALMMAPAASDGAQAPLPPTASPAAPAAPKPSSKFNDGDFGIYDLF